MKIIIIEDEVLVARDLEKLLKQLEPTIQIIHVIHSLEEAVHWFRVHPAPDLMFLDIQLSDGVSFDIFEQVQIDCPIIFTTAYNEYALRAFKLNSLDYLLKPVDKNELRQALNKYKKWFEEKVEVGEIKSQFQHLLKDLAIGQKKYKERHIVHYKNSLVPITTDKIACFLKDELIFVITKDNLKLVSQYNTLEELEDLLDPQMFFRATRQHIVNGSAIDSYKTSFNGKIMLRLHPPLSEGIEISKEKAPVFRKWFE